MWITLWKVWISSKIIEFTYCKIDKNMVFEDPVQDKEDLLCGQKKV